MQKKALFMSLFGVPAGAAAAVGATIGAVHVTAVLPEAEVERRIAQGRAPRLLVVVVASSLRWDSGIFARRFFRRRRGLCVDLSH